VETGFEALMFKNISYRIKVEVGLALAFLLFLSANILTYQSITHSLQVNRQLTQTYLAQLSLDRLYSALQDAETGQRGYVLTGEGMYLEPYINARRQVPQELKNLNSAIGLLSQERQFIKLQELINKKFNEMNRTIQLRRDKGMKEAVSIVRTHQGLHTMDQLRTLINDMKQEETKLQNNREFYHQRALHQVFNFLRLTSLVSLSLLVICYLLIYRENKQRKQAEFDLMKLNENLEQTIAQRTVELARSNQELEQFALATSHDLQAPLRKMQMFIDKIKTSKQNFLPETEENLNRIQKSANRMQGLIQDLLALSRISRKGAPFQMTDLSQLALEVADELDVLAKNNHGTIDIEALLNVEADPQQMHQLLSNLIGNGLKYHQDGMPPHVRVKAKALNREQIELTVEDNGIGIPENHHEDIFEIFQRLHGEKYEGTGIGLSIVKRIVERHSGKIRLESTPGKGSKFIVQLPLHQKTVG
jgi:signal transduction histidine kinase